ncbi:histone-lysine N-methyltransferase SETMAR-like protein [Plakobranchus ocellatus]|uniref:Histone-lysine N-methyltransferase SETMAR-like protein n=1 Tax=Plakobranchus ocellatus TaxID=259542 RepID=A0AAV4DHC9_9GAST|nr:histone-lysine N-methyltransferase SETMAR-like protein [Plakobranchus ocellatus]
MQPISAYIAAATLLATVLGVEFRKPQNFNFITGKITYNVDSNAFLLESRSSNSEYILTDLNNGRVYLHMKNGSCIYFENEDLKAFDSLPPADLQPSGGGCTGGLEVSVEAAEFEFKTFKIGSGNDCEVGYFVLNSNGSRVHTYGYDFLDDVYYADLLRVEDTLAQLQAAGCTQKFH